VWRDGGYAVGGLTLVSGLIVAGVMRETLPERR
jgi:hypothetical protein